MNEHAERVVAIDDLRDESPRLLRDDDELLIGRCGNSCEPSVRLAGEPERRCWFGEARGVSEDNLAVATGEPRRARGVLCERLERRAGIAVAHVDG